MFLDFGQKEFETRKCGACGMVYAPGDANDEAEHDLFCQREKSKSNMALGVTVPADDAVIAQSLSDGSKILCFHGSCLSKGASKALRKVLDLKSKWIDPAMGFAAEEHFDLEQRFLLVHLCPQKTVSGLMVVERISPIHNVQRFQFDNETGTLKPAKEEEKVRMPLVGVLQMWVSSKARRKGVATNLLNVARRSSVYGYVISPQDICFSQPTEQGTQFARSYTDSDMISVYRLVDIKATV